MMDKKKQIRQDWKRKIEEAKCANGDEIDAEWLEASLTDDKEWVWEEKQNE